MIRLSFFFGGGGGVLVGAVWTGEPAFTCLCAEPGSGPSERGEHRPFEWGRCVRGGLSSASALGVVRCGRSAGCVLCVLVGHIGCCVGGEYPVGVSISSSESCFELLEHTEHL